MKMQLKSLSSPCVLSFPLILSCVCVVVTALILRVLYVVRAKRRFDLPLPLGRFFPFIGQTFTFLSQLQRLNDWLKDNMLFHQGKTYQFSLPTQPQYICISHPDLIEHVLKTRFDNYPKGPEFTYRLSDLLGHGIFNVDGEEWRMQRKIASQIFTMRALKEDMTPVMVEHADSVLKRLEVCCERKESINWFALMNCFTLDSICRIAFGVNFHTIDCESTPHPFMDAFDRAQYISNCRFFSATWPLQRVLNCGLERELKRHIETLSQFTDSIVRERMSLTSDMLNQRTDILSKFIALGEERKQAFNLSFLRDVILNIIIAGRDTTSQALSWCMYELARHQHIQNQVAEEVQGVFGKARVSYEGCAQLVFVQAVLQETLRLYPSVPKELKTALADDVLPDGTHIKAGECIMPLIAAMAHRIDLWGEDASQFNPQRFIFHKADGSIQCSEPSPYKWPVFQAGPRTCLGKYLSLLEAKILLATVLKHFSITLEPDCHPHSVPSLTLPMDRALKVRVHKRHLNANQN